MAKLTIIGTDKPRLGKEEKYSISMYGDWLHLSKNPFITPMKAPKTIWHIMVQTKTGWRRAEKNKEGLIVPYTFNQKSLMHKGIKIVVEQGENRGELIVHPQRAKEPKITKVELLDGNYKPLPKGKQISYKDTIIARAHCVEMFKMNVAFTLWEDDAQGEGHDPIKNALNKINLIPVLKPVNEKGIAEAVFRLPAYTMAVQIANARIAAGDKNEGKTHEYYVTADIVNTKIQKASPNVNVTNPTYNPEPPKRQRTLPQKPKPASPPAEKPKPKPDSPKFPVTSNGKSNTDREGKILSAEFVDTNGNRLNSSKVGKTVIMKITAKDLINKKVKVIIWEEDNFTWTNDEIYNKDWILTGDVNFIGVSLTKKMFDKANDGGGDSQRQQYFIEVIYEETSVKSSVMPITLNAEPTKIPKGNSDVVIKDPKAKKQETTCLCKEQYKDLAWGEKVSCEFRKKVYEISRELWPNDYMNMANNLMAIMALETNKTFDPKTQNANGYFGLTGFGMSTVEDFQRTLDKSITKQKIMNSSAVEQLYYVKERFKFVQKYLMNNGKGGILSDFTDLYLAILYPTKSGLGRGEDSKQKIIFDASKGKVAELEYRQNPSFMKEPGEWSTKQQVTFKRRGQTVTETLRGYKDLNNAKTYRWEVTEEIINYKNEGEKYKVKTFTCQKDVKKEEPKKETKGKWHDPLNNPMCTIFTQNQIAGEFNDAGKHWGLFGKTRGSTTHYGLDLFAKPGTPIFACVKCEVYNIVTDGNVPKGYGKQIFLKVLDKETFLAHYKKYSKLYPKLEYETIGSFSKDNDIILHYAHLRKIYVKKGWIISNVDIPIGETGVSGVIQGGKPDGTCAPHLHFEIRNMNKERINPGFFINFNSYDTMSDAEKKLQQSTAKNGKIKEFSGAKDTYKTEKDYE
jgi:murein DD-endopeptidase MepM/ murein hydrolase activator NlpD